jgi:hypothetical protein
MVALVVFFARNMWCAKNILPITVVRYREYLIEPISKENLAAADRLYASLSGGKGFGLKRMALLSLLGSRLGLIARDVKTDQVVGVAFYYFNARDRKEDTVHVGFSGLHEAARSVGLGTFMRRHALMNFALSGLTGVSSRISIDNVASLKVNEKLGFVPVETYFDSSLNEVRHYLICDLRKFIKSIGKSEGIFQR